MPAGLVLGLPAADRKGVVMPVSGETQAPCERCWQVDFVSPPDFLCDDCARTTPGDQAATAAATKGVCDG